MLEFYREVAGPTEGWHESIKTDRQQLAVFDQNQSHSRNFTLDNKFTEQSLTRSGRASEQTKSRHQHHGRYRMTSSLSPARARICR